MRNRAFSRRSRARSVELSPSRSPPSTRARRTQFPRDDSPISSARATDAMLRPSSSTNPTASALNSLGNDLRTRPGAGTGRLFSRIVDMATS